MSYSLLVAVGILLCMGGMFAMVTGHVIIGALPFAVGLAILVQIMGKYKETRKKPAKTLEEFKQSLDEAAHKSEMSRTPVSAKIVGTSTERKTGSAVGRALVGDAIGGLGGAMIGAATAKNKGMTKFLVTYADGHKAMETVKDDSARFERLVAVLDK